MCRGWCGSREAWPLDGQDGHAKLEVKLRVAFARNPISMSRTETRAIARGHGRARD